MTSGISLLTSVGHILYVDHSFKSDSALGWTELRISWNCSKWGYMPCRVAKLDDHIR